MGFWSRWFGGRTKARFKQRFEEGLRAQGDERAVEWSEDGPLGVIVWDRFAHDGNELELDDTYDAWSEQGTDDAVLEAVAQVARPAAKSGAGIVPLRVRTGPSGDRLRRPIVQGLDVELLIAQGPGDVVEATEAACQAAGLTVEAVWALASTHDADEPIVAAAPRVFWVPGWPALLAFEGLTLPPVLGEPVLVSLDEGRALYTGTGEVEGLQALAAVLHERLAAEPALNGDVLVRRDGGWVRWLPGRSCEAARLVCIALRRATLFATYAVQRQALKDAKTSVFVADCLTEPQDGLVVAGTSSWAKGVVTLLPRTDAIILSSSLRSRFVVSFDAALAHLGQHMERVPGLTPPRWLVGTFPTDAELAAALVDSELRDPLRWFEDEQADERAAAPTIPREQFAREAVALLRRLGAEDLEYFEDGFGVRMAAPATALPPGVPAGSKVLRQLGFATPYQRFGGLPDVERAAALQQYFGELLSLSTPPGLTRENVLPLLRPAADDWRQRMALRVQAKGMEVVMPPTVSRAFAPGVALGFVADLGPSVRPVLQPDLDALGLSEGSAFELAVANLDRLTPRPLKALAPGVYASDYGDDYDAARLLLPRLFAGLAVKGRPVAFVPNRSALLVTGSDDEQGLALVHGALAKLATLGARPVHRAPLVLQDDGWAAWQPASGSLGAGLVRALCAEQLEADLGDELGLLQALFPTAALATTISIAASGEPLVSVDVPTAPLVLLPKADLVSQAGKEAVPWDHFAGAHPVVPVEGTGARWWQLGSP